MAVISNGTAILGLGDLGALASKPVMEGKAVLFKRFADVDSIDIEVATRDPDEIITVVKNIGVTFGGINLEDIKSPECFRIETELQELLDIPVFHDDQHGTAIISAAGLINACEITGRKLEDIKLVLCGAGAAGIASLELIKAMGVRPENCIAVDTTGVIYRGRAEGMNQWKSAHAVDTDARTLADAIEGRRRVPRPVGQGRADPGDGRVHGRPSRSSSPWPIPIRRSRRRRCRAVRPDAIVATGRSDYPNQVNNVLGFPYIFRGALDVRARRVNHEMKIACAQALAAAGARGRARRGGRRLSRPQAEVRAGIHHPLAVRSAADLVHPALRRPGGDGHRRGAQADRRHGRLSRQPGPAARSHRRLPAEDRPARVQSAAQASASSSPRARSPR